MSTIESVEKYLESKRKKKPSGSALDEIEKALNLIVNDGGQCTIHVKHLSFQVEIKKGTSCFRIKEEKIFIKNLILISDVSRVLRDENGNHIYME